MGTSTKDKQTRPGEQLYEKARGMHNEGKMEQARVVYVMCLESNPGHADALSSLALLYLQSGMLDMAEKLYRNCYDM